jgi:hypothetical protein
VKTLGLRIKSGFAIAVVVSGEPRAWVIVSRHDVALTDGTDEYARFPFHPAIEMASAAAAKAATKRALAAIESTAKREIAALVASAQPLDGAALVVGSLIDPDDISNAHMRAHASEGRLYREVVGKELDRHQIRYELLLERDAYAFVAARLNCDAAPLRTDVDRHGKQVVKPWRAEEKLAALAAYWQLADTAD